MMLIVLATLMSLGMSKILIQKLSSQSQEESWHVEVSFTVNKNTRLLRHNSFLDSSVFACHAFDVWSATGRLTDIGAVAKRREHTEDDMVALTAGEQVGAYVDLSYCFQFQEGNTYTVQLREEQTFVAKQPTQARKLSFVAMKTSVLPWQSRGFLQAVGNNGCSDSEWVTVEESIANAVAGLEVAFNDNLEGGCAGSEFTKWFGTYSQERFWIIHENFRRIQERFLNEDYTVECHNSGCSAGVFAYVYPTDSAHIIYVCDSYWSASVTLQQDSKPGTLIHEMSHFEDVAGTSDHMYGWDANQDLADSDPCLAVDNADSHEYYVEQGLTMTGCCSESTLCNEDHCSDGCANSTLEECTATAICEQSAGDDIECVTCTTYEECFPGCIDVANWVDSDGDDCHSYWVNNWCEAYGAFFENDGYTANEACCACSSGSALGPSILLISMVMVFNALFN